MISYADDSTLMAVVTSSGFRVTVGEPPIRDLGRVSEWCDLWGIKLNASNNMTMIIVIVVVVVGQTFRPISSN